MAKTIEQEHRRTIRIAGREHDTRDPGDPKTDSAGGQQTRARGWPAQKKEAEEIITQFTRSLMMSSQGVHARTERQY